MSEESVKTTDTRVVTQEALPGGAHPAGPAAQANVPDDGLAASLESAASAALASASLVEKLASEISGVDDLRLRHLSDLIEKGALDQELFEAVVHGVIYLLDSAQESPQVLESFRLRFKCDLRAYETARDLLRAVAERRPSAVLILARATEPGACEMLPGLLVACYGDAPVPVVLVSDDPSWLTTFEVLTYPQLSFVNTGKGPDGLLSALEQFVKVERTGASLRTDEMLKEQIGLTKARAIQQNLLPETIPSVPGLDIAAYYRPCQDVGGDYYDFLPRPDGRLGVVCADVSGKGVGAAMVMVMFRSMLRLAAKSKGSPHDVMVVTNRLVSRDMMGSMFVSAVYLVLDPKTGRTELVNAGHMPVLHWPSDQVRPVKVPLGGMAVGVAAGKQFAAATRQGEIELAPGELLCLYTDGIVEAENPAHEQFGEERLIEAIRGAGRVASQEVINRVNAAVESFCSGAPQHDDTTLIILRTL